MILVDKEIKQRADEIFQEGYCESNVTAISYDLHIQGIISEDELVKKYTLRPGEVVFIKTKEKIKKKKKRRVKLSVLLSYQEK